MFIGDLDGLPKGDYDALKTRYEQLKDDLGFCPPPFPTAFAVWMRMVVAPDDLQYPGENFPSGDLEQDWPHLHAVLKKLTGLGISVPEGSSPEEPLHLGTIKALLEHCDKHQISSKDLALDVWVEEDEGHRAKLISSLVWTLICKFEVSEVVEPGQPAHVRELMGRDALKLWASGAVYPHVIDNFLDSWRDGTAFVALLEFCQTRCQADSMASWIDYNAMSPTEKLQAVFGQFEDMGVPRMLDAKCVCGERPCITYEEDLPWLGRAIVVYLSTIHNKLMT